MIDKSVVNASPLILLAKIGRLALLSHLYAEIVIPKEVAAEIRTGPVGDPARSWLNVSGQSWIREVGAIEPVIAAWDLGMGESEVLTWAHRHLGYEAIVDDRAARNTDPTIGPLRKAASH